MGNSGGVVKADPAIMTMAAAPTASGSNTSHTLSHSVMTAANGLMDVLSTVNFIEGASSLAAAIDEFGTGVMGALACYGTGLDVVASGLRVAASAFAATDKQLVTMFTALDAQLPMYAGFESATLPALSTSQIASLNALGATTATQTFQTTTISLSSAMQHAQAQGGGGFSFSGMFHSVVHTIGGWASGAGHTVGNFVVNDLGAPPVLGTIAFVTVAGMVWVVAGSGAAAAAAG